MAKLKRNDQALIHARLSSRHKSAVIVAALSGLLALFSADAVCQNPEGEIPAGCKASISQEKLPFGVQGRLKLLPTGPLKAGEPNEIPVTLEGPPISCIFDGPGEDVSVRHHADGTPYLVFTPTQLGKIHLAMMAFFSDGGLSAIEADVQVVPSDRRPAALMLQAGGVPDRDTDLISLGLDDNRWKQDSEYREHIYAAAYYLDSRKPVEIAPEYLHFSVKQPQDKPVVEVSQDGGIKPLRAGDALLRVTFGEVTRAICIEVSANSWAADTSRCEQLRSPQPAAPLDTVWTTNPDGLRSSISNSEYFVSRLTVTPPNHPVELAQPVRITITIGEGKIRRITYEQKRSGGNARLSFNHVVPPAGKPLTNSDLEDGHFLKSPGESIIFELIPVELGDETVRIVAEFEDGGFDERFFHLKTEPTDRSLDHIDVNYTSYPPGHPHLNVGLKYRQLSNPIIVYALDRVQLSVTPANIVRFDTDGTAHELQNGTAVASVRLGAVQGSTAVHVDLSQAKRESLRTVTGDAALPDAQGGLPLIRITGLSDTDGVDLAAYLSASKRIMKSKWRELFGTASGNWQNAPGEVAIRFKLLPSGYIVNGSIMLDRPSGSTSLDRAAWGTVANSRFQPLPHGLRGTVEVRAVFSNN